MTTVEPMKYLAESAHMQYGYQSGGLLPLVKRGGGAVRLQKRLLDFVKIMQC